jgi:hypothetical protein
VQHRGAALLARCERLVVFGAPFDLHADGLHVVELARLDHPHAHPGSGKLLEQDVGDRLGKGLQQLQAMLGHQLRQARMHARVVDGVADAVGVAGQRVRHAGVHIDHQGLRRVQLAAIDADHGLAGEALDEHEVQRRNLQALGGRRFVSERLGAVQGSTPVEVGSGPPYSVANCRPAAREPRRLTPCPCLSARPTMGAPFAPRLPAFRRPR